MMIVDKRSLRKEEEEDNKKNQEEEILNKYPPCDLSKVARYPSHTLDNIVKSTTVLRESLESNKFFLNGT